MARQIFHTHSPIDRRTKVLFPDLDDLQRRIPLPLRHTNCFEPVKCVPVYLHCYLFRTGVPADATVDLQAFQVDCPGEEGEGRVIECFVCLGVAPSFDRDICQSSDVPGPDVGEEGVQCHCVFEGEGVLAVEDGLGFAVDLAVYEEQVGHQGGQGGRV